MNRKDLLLDFRNKVLNTESGLQETRQGLQKVVLFSDIPQEEKDKLINIYDKWEPGQTVKPGDIRRHNGKLFEAIQGHTTQSDWEPQNTPALWKESTPKETEEGEEIVPDWKQPLGGHDAYKKGDRVRFEGKVYESLKDGNAYSPAADPAGWKEIE